MYSMNQSDIMLMKHSPLSRIFYSKSTGSHFAYEGEGV